MGTRAVRTAITAFGAVLLLACMGGSAAGAKPPVKYAENPNDIRPDSFGPPMRLERVQQGSAKGGVTTQSYSASRYKVHVLVTPYWGSVRNEAHSFFTGSVANGDYIDVTNNSDGINYFGEVRHAGFGYCGSIFASNLDPYSSGVSDCPSNFYSPPSGSSQYINCETCNGGWAVQLSTSAELYRNVYPWNVPANGYDAAGINRPAGYTVYWRYVSEDGQWVAVSDPDPTPAVSNMSWFFVRKTALPTICGSGANAKAPSTPSHADWGLVCKNAAEGG